MVVGCTDAALLCRRAWNTRMQSSLRRPARSLCLSRYLLVYLSKDADAQMFVGGPIDFSAEDRSRVALT